MKLTLQFLSNTYRTPVNINEQYNANNQKKKQTSTNKEIWFVWIRIYKQNKGTEIPYLISVGC